MGYFTYGANIEDANGEMNVILEIRPNRSHFRDSGKFNGISGSVCDSHPTIPLSRSEIGSFTGSSRAVLLREVSILDSRLLVLALVSTFSIGFVSAVFLCPDLTDPRVYHN